MVDVYSLGRPARNKRYQRVSLIAVFIFLVVPCSLGGAPTAMEKTRTGSSEFARFTRIVAVAVVDTVLFWDRFFTKRSTVVSPDSLHRIADPSSRFYQDYLAYKHGRIGRADLVARLPHVALIGDSLSKNFYVSSVASVFWRARTEEQRNWFLDTGRSANSIYSLYERMNELTPLVATEYARTGAIVSAQASDEDLLHMVGHADNFARQVDELLKAKRFPDLLLIWIGHNNLCWTTDLTAEEKKHPEIALPRQTTAFKTNYVRQLRRILDRAKKEDHKISIVVFGLVNTKGYFAARETAEAMRRNDRKLFPYAEVDYVRCEAMKPEYRRNIVRLELAINRELRSSVRALGNELRSSPKVRLQYSGVAAEKNIDDITLLSRYDAWHLSPKGHDLVAQSVFDALTPSFDFLGIRSEPRTAKH